MSALFESGSGVLTKSSTVPSTLELRHIPFVQVRNETLTQKKWEQGLILDQNDDHPGKSLLQDLYYNLETDWLYTAIIQMALKGPEPVWSKDEWSFVPVISDWQDFKPVKHNSTGSMSGSSSVNLTVSTPAIRARLQCSVLDWPKNLTYWLEDRQTNRAMNITGLDNYYWPVGYVHNGNVTTRLTAQAREPTCCANLTGDAAQQTLNNPTVIAYWTENWKMFNGSTGNFTIKWIRGPATFAEILVPGQSNLIFPEPPAIQALNCMPSFEGSEAEVTVDPASGVVQEYRILDDPHREDVAWSDAFQFRNISEVPRFSNSSDYRYFDIDVTTR